MAPVTSATKRSSIGGATQHSANKKRRCSEVSAALKGATLEAYPGATLRMLANAVPESLGEPKAARHSFQTQIADMVGKVLSGMEKTVEAEIQAAQAAIDGADGKKETLDSALQEAETNFAAKHEASNTASVALVEARKGRDAAAAALQFAEKEQSIGDAALTDAIAQKAKLEDAVTNMFNPLKSSGTCEDKTAVKSLGKIGQDLGLDDLLLKSLPQALKTVPGERGSWDSYAIGEFEVAIKKKIVEFDATLADGESSKAACAAAVDAAKSSAETAEATCESSAVALKDAKDAESGALSAKKDAAHAVKTFEPEMKRSHAASAALKATLEAHQTGAMASYQELLELSEYTPPPLAPEPVVEERQPTSQAVGDTL